MGIIYLQCKMGGGVGGGSMAVIPNQNAFLADQRERFSKKIRKFSRKTAVYYSFFDRLGNKISYFSKLHLNIVENYKKIANRTQH